MTVTWLVIFLVLRLERRLREHAVSMPYSTYNRDMTTVTRRVSKVQRML